MMPFILFLGEGDTFRTSDGLQTIKKIDPTEDGLKFTIESETGHIWEAEFPQKLGEECIESLLHNLGTLAGKSKNKADLAREKISGILAEFKESDVMEQLKKGMKIFQKAMEEAKTGENK